MEDASDCVNPWQGQGLSMCRGPKLVPLLFLSTHKAIIEWNEAERFSRSQSPTGSLSLLRNF